MNSNRLEKLLDGLDDLGKVECLKGLLEVTPKATVPPVPNGKPTVGRDKGSGRFTAGNQCARGRANPHARKQAAFRALLTESFNAEQFRLLVRKLITLALGGDLEAIKFLFAYLLGKPTAAPDPDLLDLAEWQLLEAQPTIHELARATVDGVDAGQAGAFLRDRQAGDKVDEQVRKADAATVLAQRDRRAGRRRKASAALPS